MVFSIEPIQLLRNSHANTGTTGKGCFMNIVAYLNGESQITDQSDCVCEIARPFYIRANDMASDFQRKRLLPFLLRAMGSRSRDRAEKQRRIDWVVLFAKQQAAHAQKFAAAAARYAAAAAAAAAAEAKNFSEAQFEEILTLLDNIAPKAEEPAPQVVMRAKELAALEHCAAPAPYHPST